MQPMLISWLLTLRATSLILKFVGNAKVEYDQKKALEGADFVYAKNWSCPGVKDPAQYGEILSKDMSWTIDEEHMSWTNDGCFMHCLPVRRG